MEKVFKVADIRKFEQQVEKGEISCSRMVELINEMAHNYYVVSKKCNSQNVNACACCGSSDLLKFKLEHIKCRNCNAQFEHGC